MSKLFAQRLRSARMLSGLSLQELADKLETTISRQALHKYETGDVMPDSAMLDALANALGVRPDFFFREREIELGEIEFRKLEKLPAKEENKIVEEVKDMLARYLELEEILNIGSSFENPLQGYPVNSFDDIEAAAIKLRKYWNLGTDPIANAIQLLEDNHIKVIQVNAGDSFDGMQAWVNGNIPVIAVNMDQLKSADRIRFTVMHELCHLLLKDITNHEKKQKEICCHQFAAAMLLPAEAIKKQLGESRKKIMFQELGLLKKEYGISMQAIIMRARDLQIITESYCKQFFFLFRQMGWKQAEPEEYNYSSEEASSRFSQLLYKALAEEVISVSKAAALNNQLVAEFRDKFLRV